MIKNKYSWHQYFMTMAYLVATKSKATRTKVGSVIVGPDLEIRSSGYNGLPRGLADLEPRYAKPLKYDVMNHAEENAIINCCRIGVSTRNCTIYVPWIPCTLCAKSIIQAGISQVVYHKQWPGNNSSEEKWINSIALAKEMLSETSVELIAYSGPLIKISAVYDSEEYDPMFHED